VTEKLVKTMDFDSPSLQDLVRQALAEDIGSGDATSLATVPAGASATARIIARAPLVCAGLPLVERVFRALDQDIELDLRTKDGDLVETDGVILRCCGKARAILAGERTALNFLAHLSGIATLTRSFVGQLAGTGAQIRDTRKTTPGLRGLEKYAVRMGGGTNHRFGLYDAFLLKENHIAVAGGIKPALDKAHAYVSSQITPQQMSAYDATAPLPKNGLSNSLPIQIEVRDEGELRQAIQAGAESVLLDNMTPESARECVALARRLRPDCIVEVSGGITLQNARGYSETGANFLSAGLLTHSAPAANLTLLVDSIGGT
jgi:nicotinate-nucleotide pyrophosphorylase (carboxylating)